MVQLVRDLGEQKLSRERAVRTDKVLCQELLFRNYQVYSVQCTRAREKRKVKVSMSVHQSILIKKKKVLSRG